MTGTPQPVDGCGVAGSRFDPERPTACCPLPSPHRPIAPAVAALLAAALLAVGCATAPEPVYRRNAERVLCLQLPAPLSFASTNSEGRVVAVTRLQRGPYVAELVDDGGTYFRGPPGGISVSQPAMENRPGYLPMTSHGGVWLPRDASLAPRLYTYFSTRYALERVHVDEDDCSTVAFLRDATGRIAIADTSSVGTVVRDQPAGSPMAFGPVGGMNGAGAAIGGSIVAAIVNQDVGKLRLQDPLTDAAFVAALRREAAKAVPLQEVRLDAPPAGR